MMKIFLQERSYKLENGNIDTYLNFLSASEFLKNFKLYIVHMYLIGHYVFLITTYSNKYV